MKNLVCLLCLLLAACSDNVYLSTDIAVGRALQFEVEVLEQSDSRSHVMEEKNSQITKDFKKGDSFGLFILADNRFVEQIDGKNARNIKLTTPDGKAWNLNSSITEVVHKLGYRYVAYYPYSPTFDDCATYEDMKSRLTPPALDQRSMPATDWLYTEITAPQTNAVTPLHFKHKYAKIEIYNSYTQDHHDCDWTGKYLFTKTVDDTNVEHYRYIYNAEQPESFTVKGKYTIGNYLTGIKECFYNCNDVIVANGRHSIVYTYGMDERCAVDLGLPSGVKWSPINMGTETGTYMDETAIDAMGNVLGMRLAWGELLVKDSYNYANYMNDPYQESAQTLLPTNIAETVYDPAKQYWGGHWSLPTADDMKELIEYTEVAQTESVYSEELGKNIKKITLRSKRNGNTITFLTNGYFFNSSVTADQEMYYMSATLGNKSYCMVLNSKDSMNLKGYYRYVGYNIRPVLKERHIITNEEKKDILLQNIDEMAVDLGIRKTVTEKIGGVPQTVTYKVLWSPFNYGVETQVSGEVFNNAPIDENGILSLCKTLPGKRFAWGYQEEAETFSMQAYFNSEVGQRAAYQKNNTEANKDDRNLLPEDDVVQVNWPDGWCIPTATDLELLAQNTDTVLENSYIKLSGKGEYAGNSILVPRTGYKDDSSVSSTSSAFLQSCTIGIDAGNKTYPYSTIFALNLSSTSGQLISKAGRRTGLMIRPVKYVRVE